MSQESRNFKDNIYGQLARIGKAIASPKRLEILDILSQGTKTVEVIARETEMSVANTSQHLQTLLEARLVEYHKQGIYSYYKLADRTVTNFILSLQLLAEKRIAEVQQLREEIYQNRDNMEPIKINQLMERMKSENVTLIDVRPKEEYDMMHISSAISLPIEELEQKISSLPKEHDIIAYCRGRYCLLSLEAVDLLKKHGFKAIRLEDGVQEWKALTNIDELNNNNND